MRQSLFFFLFLSLVSCSTSQQNSDQSTGDTNLTKFTVRNLCNKPINFSLTKLQYQTQPTLALGVTSNKILGVSISTKTTNRTDTIQHQIEPFQKLTLNQSNKQYSEEEKLTWFRQFRIKPVSGLYMHDPYDSSNWLKSRNKGSTIYTFFLCKN